MAEGEKIEIKGARVHNLKNIDLEIPRDSLVVVTGLSGSGKSSLAFDTIYAEGQRRYMETMSSYARQFIGVMQRPDVDEIKGLSPIIAIEQKTVGRNPRSTVGTITEIYDYLRLLYARASQAFSPESGKEMVRYTDDEIVDLIIRQHEGEKILVLSPVVKGRKGHYRELFDQLQKKGYNQVRIDGQMTNLSDAGPLDRYKIHFVELVVDKIVPSEESRPRVKSAVTTALSQGKGSMAILKLGESAMQHLSRNFVCPDTGLSYDAPAPFTFSFNSPQGACPHCRGLGMVAKVDMDKIIPDRSRSIADGGIELIGPLRSNNLFKHLEAIARKYKFSLHSPIAEIPPEALQTILYGTDELLRIGEGSDTEMDTFQGILAELSGGSDDESERRGRRKELYLEEEVCPVCHGTRLKAEALNFKVDGLNIAQVSEMDIDALQKWIDALPGRLSNRQNTIAADILKELSSRVGFLRDVGLSYLSLNRATKSLSGGESQRIRLATQIGSRLVNVLYILDEPSIGLHQRDNRKLIDSLKALRDRGNSVMVVEHDEEMMRSADFLVDLGPGAGEHGGQLLFAGSPESAAAQRGSTTLDYLSGVSRIEIPAQRRLGSGKFLTLSGARGNNLKNVTLRLPLGLLVGISGVSGSGKSSLINETLMPILSNRFYRSLYPVLPYSSIEGIENIDKIVQVDQTPIGRSPRSNPATYTDVMTDIRRLFEETPDAKVRGFKANRFSFNVKGGRCEECKGAGVQLIEMHFLPTVQVTCCECGGLRYKPDTLAVRYKGKNISEVLEMTVSKALEFFAPIPSIAQKLQTLEDVGLGYLTLGQPATTLSGGESQRLKLSAELSRRDTGNTLYLLDEPTTGLHFEDVRILLGVLQKLVDKGNTVVIIEHNLDVLKSVDYLVDLGPEGGAAGGQIIAEGTPEEVSLVPGSYTGQYLRELLRQHLQRGGRWKGR